MIEGFETNSLEETDNYVTRKSLDRPYPRVTSKVSADDGSEHFAAIQRAMKGLQFLTAKFPFEVYEVMDNLAMADPYISKFHHTTVSLGNTGHNLEINASSEAEAQEAIAAANDLAARCFPLSGGMDGLVNGAFSQIARSGGLCIEWVPNATLSRIEQAFLVPVKTIRFRYKKKGQLQILQSRPDSLTLVPLNPVQTTYHATTIRDGNPYPTPPALAAMEGALLHRDIMKQVRGWMNKVSALGVLTASVAPPPREPGEDQAQYDAKAQTYINSIAKSIKENLDKGLGISYDNIQFQFNNTSAGAQGAKDILQIVLQGLFAALQRDPVFFGWNFNSTETFARVVYEEMIQGIKTFQLGVKRALEHGHRLNLALQGMGNLGISVTWKTNRSIDAFRDAQAEQMTATAIIAQMEAGIITPEEARKLLGHNEQKAEAGEFIASFHRPDHTYRLLPFQRQFWVVPSGDNKMKLQKTNEDKK